MAEEYKGPTQPYNPTQPYKGPNPPIVPLYAATIHHCILTGDLNKMKALATEAEQYGDVSAALQLLKVEIARMEGKH